MVRVIGIKSVKRVMAQNYYDILGISKNASDKDIKSAYRRMARKLHPDVNPDDSRAQNQFKKVNEAFEVVGDPSRRKDYDHFGDNWKLADQIRECRTLLKWWDWLQPWGFVRDWARRGW